MSATDCARITHPGLHKSFTDSIRYGYDVTDHNDKASVTSSSLNGKEQPMSGPTEQASAEVTNATPTTNQTTATRSPQMDLNREEVRLVTFDNENWDVPFLNKSKLAQIGFYYIGPQDTVKCHFCRVEIGKWEADDDCFTEHSRWSPSCPLLRRQQTDNVPIDAEALNQILPPITYDTCGLSGGGVLIRPNAYAERSFTPSAENEQSSQGSLTPESSEDVGNVSPFRFTAAAAPTAIAVPASAPSMDSHATAAPLLATMNQMYAGNTMGGSSPSYFNPITTPHLEIEANRLKTFKEWPINLKMKPAELSDAGFFYTGVGDRVQCFSCGGGLKNWEDDDVAWEQHALWYPNCEYMKLIRGQKYIDAVQSIHRQKQQQQQQLQNGEGEDDEDVQESSDEGEQEVTSEAGPVSLPAMAMAAAATSQDVVPLRNRIRALVSMPSTSMAGSSTARKVARRRQGSGSHPEADLKSAEAILRAKSAKPSEVPENKICKICYELEFNTAFIPCGHVVACAKCASSVTTCPMCREPFDSVTRIYFS